MPTNWEHIIVTELQQSKIEIWIVKKKKKIWLLNTDIMFLSC